MYNVFFLYGDIKDLFPISRVFHLFSFKRIFHFGDSANKNSIWTKHVLLFKSFRGLFWRLYNGQIFTKSGNNIAQRIQLASQQCKKNMQQESKQTVKNEIVVHPCAGVGGGGIRESYMWVTFKLSLLRRNEFTFFWCLSSSTFICMVI